MLQLRPGAKLKKTTKKKVLKKKKYFVYPGEVTLYCVFYVSVEILSILLWSVLRQDTNDLPEVTEMI